MLKEANGCGCLSPCVPVVDVGRVQGVPASPTVTLGDQSTGPDGKLVFCFQPGPVESERTQVLVLGLDGSGKTSLLRCFSGGGPERDTAPTRGFNAVSVSRDDLRVEFLESEL